MKRSGIQLARFRLCVRRGVVAGVVAQLQKLLDVGVPGFEIDAAGALALAALVDRRDRRVERLQPRHDAVGMPVGAADQRAARADAVIGHADAAREFRQQRDVRVLLVDRFEVVLRRIEQIAGRHLRVARARVEKRRACWACIRSAESRSIELDRLGRVSASPHATRMKKYCGVSITARGRRDACSR